MITNHQTTVTAVEGLKCLSEGFRSALNLKIEQLSSSEILMTSTFECDAVQVILMLH